MLEVLDMGSPIGRRRPGSAAWEASVLRYFAGWATKIHGDTIPNSIPGSVLSYTLKEPVGVVAAIVPWNRPISNAVWKIAPALAAGCTMILKPSEEASLVALRLGELLRECGVPDGVVNIVTGYGESVGAALTAHPDVDKVAFTGSTQTGQQIVRASAGNLKRLDSSSAASRRMSCSPMPTSRKRFRVPEWACSPTAGRCAPQEPAFTWNARSTRSS